MSLKFFVDIRDSVFKARTSIMSLINASVKRKIKPEDIDTTEEATTETTESLPTKKQKVLLPEHSLNDSEYYIDNGLRKVYPYYFTYYSHCKGRWMGQPLAEFFAQEFKGMPLDKIKKQIEEGSLLVNNEKVCPDYKIKGHDLITNRTHRHELSVLSAPIPIIHLSKDVVVIDKPPSLPIHPTGKYRQNTVVSVLTKEHELGNLHIIHRLDRLTSGVLVIARNPGTAQALHEQLRNRELHKEYVSRVEGKFPDGVITCDQPIETLNHRIGINIVNPSGKPSSTTFERLNYNGKSSTVLCRPKTGRMHQIRVHLQYLGHPIINDNFYNNKAFGPQKGKDGQYNSREEIIKEIEAQHQRSLYLMVTENAKKILMSDEEKQLNERKREIALKALFHYTNREEWNSLTEKYKYDSSKLIEDNDCEECVNKTIDPNPYDLLIYLHALAYKGPDWEYRTELPIWAKDDWDYD